MPEEMIVEKLGVPANFYKVGNKKFISYSKKFDYNFGNNSKFSNECFISLNITLSILSGKVVDAKASELSFGKTFDQCTGKFTTAYNLGDYGCY